MVVSAKERKVLAIGLAAIVVGMGWGLVVGFEVMKMHPNWWFVGVSTAIFLVPLLIAWAREEGARNGVMGEMPAWLTIFRPTRKVFLAGVLIGAVLQAAQTP